MRRKRVPYDLMAFICLAVSVIGMYLGEDVTYLWIACWGCIIMSEVAK